MLAEVTDEPDLQSAFTIMPGFRVRNQNDPVVVTDQVTLLNWKRSTPERPNTLHVNARNMGTCTNPDLGKDASEIHGWDEPSAADRERQMANPSKQMDKPTVSHAMA